MKLPVSEKTASYGRKPQIRKGYYPAQLTEVREFTDKDGKIKDCKFGHQLIFEFAIFKGNQDTGEPIEHMKFTDESSKPTVTKPVMLSKFVYHKYKDKTTGDLQTAVTQNSAITKLLISLGWTFSPQDVDIDTLIGNWIEVNVDDYDQKEGDSTYPASTIKDFNAYKGPKTKLTAIKSEEKSSESKDSNKPAEPKEIKKSVAAKNEETKEESPIEKDKTSTVADLDEKLEELTKLKNDGLLSEKGYNDAVEQINAKKELVK